ncbi:MAG: UDP-galactopyranose mutase [Verrucomicrobiota bacterium]|jgi:UDP-galactopyranose mutase|nr:UDP-galactopyranose mutase [Verrucomicrobiota bacterium]
MDAKNKTVVIVGAGFYGAVMAERFANAAGCRVVLLEKRGHIGGNSWSCADPETGIEEHVYGPHIFHTSDERVWEYINRFTAFNGYRHTVWAARQGKVYPLPFGLAAINLLMGKRWSPQEAEAWVLEEAAKEGIHTPQNLEEKALSLIGRPLYEAFVKEYTEKHWGRKATELPAYIISRLPVRYTYNVGYYKDVWQGIPVEGYGRLFGRMLEHPNIEVRLEADYAEHRDTLPEHRWLIYTGAIDQFFGFRHGRLGWRSVRFDRQVLDVPDYQGTAVLNECDGAVAYTRTHEFKHFTPERRFDRTVVYREFSFSPSEADDVYYPIRTPEDQALLAKYEAEAAALPKVHFGGRLGSYAYLDMDQAIAAALTAFDQLAGD